MGESDHRDARVKHNAIIVDDERLARAEMKRLLADHGEVSVAGEAEDIAGAIHLIREKRPDVVFLDIQLSNENGFSLLEQVDRTFKVVFVTAFDAFAVRAFAINALDYLLKPVNPERLAAAIARLGEERAEKKARTTPLKEDDRILLEVGRRAAFVKVRDISCITAAGDYAEVVTSAGQTYLHETSLKEWESRLPVESFLRIHRQTLVNLDEVERIEIGPARDLQVVLKRGDRPFAVSRRHAAELRRRFR